MSSHTLPPEGSKTEKKPVCCRRQCHRASSPSQSRPHLLKGLSRKPPASQGPVRLNKLQLKVRTLSSPGWQAILSLSITCWRDLLLLVSFWIYKMLSRAVCVSASDKKKTSGFVICLIVYLFGASKAVIQECLLRNMMQPYPQNHFSFPVIPSLAEQPPRSFLRPFLWLHTCWCDKWGCVFPSEQMDAQGVDVS